MPHNAKAHIVDLNLKIMAFSIWQINGKDGFKLGIIKTPVFLDIIDVSQRAKNKFGDDCDYQSPIYVGVIND